MLIVIVNYRTADLVVDCLRALAPEMDGEMRVVVTDNLSADDSVARIGAAIQENGWGFASVMALGKNGGFAFGNNAAIRGMYESKTLPEFVLLLNPDTLVRPGAVAELSAFMEAHPTVGIAGSRLENMDGTAQISAFRFPTILSEFEGGMRLGLVSRLLRKWMIAPPVQGSPHETGWVAGASFMIRREVFERIGLFDEAYFMYYEEVDFCLRARRAGWACWYVPASRVVHLVGRASGINSADRRPKRTPEYVHESRRRYFLKNHGRVYTIVADAAYLAAFSFWRLRRRIQRRPDTDPPHALGDFFRHSFGLKST